MTLTPTKGLVDEALLNGETARLVTITVVPAETGRHDDRWIITLDYGWAQTNIAVCDYEQHASGVALAVAYALDCDVKWLNA